MNVSMADQSGMRRPRTRSMLSFSSTTKRRSGLFGKGMDMTETKEEKEATHLHGKADPTRAVNEPQPDAWSFEKSTMQPLRMMQHRDANGNVIADPDRSNPTRSRLERPLDTIRSFEAAIDCSYSRPSMSRASTSMGPAHRQTQSAQGFVHPARQFVENGGYHGGRLNNPRPESYAESSYGGQPFSQHPARRFNQRVYSEPSLNSYNGQGVYPAPGYQQSYDTVATSANGSGGYTDQWRDSTDPSSESSSIERLPQPSKLESTENYGLNGFGAAPQFQDAILEEHSIGTPAYGEPGYGGSQRSRGAGARFQGQRQGALPPTPPPHSPPKDERPRVPIKLNGPTSPTTGGSEKRKSWLKRRFSKNG